MIIKLTRRNPIENIKKVKEMPFLGDLLERTGFDVEQESDSEVYVDTDDVFFAEPDAFKDAFVIRLRACPNEKMTIAKECWDDFAMEWIGRQK